ncbi:hypothetical protein GGX14DRAFT_404926 [Mycena pura]|uniref:Uncharacterized protein n=1 Tax=Mycena pura TaxID=153505 RepID=A0AAD6XZQ7_9AGAR|nr:hypothetical protein GGX14DRAFT_404926 [Mycena pura]
MTTTPACASTELPDTCLSRRWREREGRGALMPSLARSEREGAGRCSEACGKREARDGHLVQTTAAVVLPRANLSQREGAVRPREGPGVGGNGGGQARRAGAGTSGDAAAFPRACAHGDRQNGADAPDGRQIDAKQLLNFFLFSVDDESEHAAGGDVHHRQPTPPTSDGDMIRHQPVMACHLYKIKALYSSLVNGGHRAGGVAGSTDIQAFTSRAARLDKCEGGDAGD